MALNEQRVLNQITVLPNQSAVNVQWADQILRDGELISQQFHRKSYTSADKEAFLVEVEDAQSYIQILGW